IERAPRYEIASPDTGGLTLPLWDPAVLQRAIERARRGEVVSDDIGWQPVAGRLAALAVTRPAPPPEGDPVSWDVAVASGSLADASGDPVLLDSLGTPSVALAPAAGGRERHLVSFPQANGYAIVGDTTGRVVG